MSGPAKLSIRLADVTRDQGGNLRLGDLVGKEDLKQLLAMAEQSDAYRDARNKYEFRIKETGGDVFLELKRRSTGFFGKLTGFVRAPMRQAERNAAIVSLAKFNDAWQSEANRKLFSGRDYRATTKATAREFHTDLVERVKRNETAAAAARTANALAWNAIRDGEIDRVISEAAARAGVDPTIALIGKDDIVSRLGIMVGDLDQRILEPTELRGVLDDHIDRIIQRQKVKLEEIAKIGITDPIETELVTNALLSSGQSMPAAYFDQARQAGEGLASGLKRLGGLSPEERRKAAEEIAKTFLTHVAAAGNAGGQEVHNFCSLTAAVAAKAAGSELLSMKDTVAAFLDIAMEFRMGDDDHLSAAGGATCYALAGMAESIERAAGPNEGGAV